MRTNVVRERIAAGEPAVNAWLAIGSGYSAEGMGHAGFHSATVDLQHGMIGFSEALTMLQAISATPATPLVRVPELNESKIMHLLDAGALGVICPMISTPEEARRLVAACRYPPQGIRSFGPARGLLYGGTDYVAAANGNIMAIPMIETAEGVARIEEILEVAGIDMVYLGPNDIAYAMDGHVGGERPNAERAIRHVLDCATRKGIPVGIFCATADEALERLSQGFAMVSPANDFSHLTRSGAEAVRKILAGNQPPAKAAASHGY